MKYANLCLDIREIENIGDWVQIFAIDNLYHYMGIDKKDIVRIRISELNTYQGEKVILPINYPFYGLYNLSDDIIPVYLGISIIDSVVAKGLKFKEFEPIGCRDIHTYNELSKCGIDSYYGGCLTITFPKRKSNSNAGKIFIVDVSDNIYSKIPNEISENAERITHIIEDGLGGESVAKGIYKRYEEEAKLVITSRIHCAQPCLAMGIPTIFICETISFRYDVIKNLLPIYHIDQMENINWKPEPVDFEEMKKLMLENARLRIMETYRKHNIQDKINSFYSKGHRLEYYIDSVWAFEEYIQKRYKREERFEYILWGVTQIAEKIYEWISVNYPNAVLKYVIDMYHKTKFHGIETTTTEILKSEDLLVLVTAGAANKIAKKLFDEYHISHYVICYNGTFVIDGENKEYL